MDTNGFWKLVEAARQSTPDTAEPYDIAKRMIELLRDRPPAEIAAYEQPMWDLMDVSYTEPLWAAAYIVHGGASDDAFDYFRGWLIAQGRTVFERAVADPDSLADHPAIIEGAQAGEADVEGGVLISVVFKAYLAATGEELPFGTTTRNIPELGHTWDFDDHQAMREHLPRLAAMYYD